MNTGLYGQDEGNGKRSASLVLSDHLRANQIAEGEYLTKMVSLAKKKNFKAMGELRNEMRNSYIQQGVPSNLAQERADSVLRQGMSQVKL